MAATPSTIISETRLFLFTIYRILPFIIVAYFFISSIFSGDVSGFLILVGILLSSIITILASRTQYFMNGIFENKINTSWNSIPDDKKTASANNQQKIIDSLKYCNWFTIGNNPISYLPLSTHIYWFLYSYFFYVMGINDVLAKNWFLLLVMSGLLFVDGYYNREACIGNYVIVPILFGIVSGVSWAAIVGPKNHMIPLLSQKTQCSAQTSRYSCRIKRTGQVINT
jgi:hypothetical protein